MAPGILARLRRRLLDAPLGFGHPVPATVFDAEFRSGHWQLLDAADEQARYAALAALVRQHPAPIRLLDAGCGSGRLGATLDARELALYHGVDLSAEALRQARSTLPAGAVLEQADLETWNPAARFDVMVFNEVIGYFHDPAATVARLAAALEPGGLLVVSLYRWGNAAAIWRRLESRLESVAARVVVNPNGDKRWDLRILRPPSARVPA